LGADHNFLKALWLLLLFLLYLLSGCRKVTAKTAQTATADTDNGQKTISFKRSIKAIVCP
jgi:hypothetical protein